jgi:hypothetical protein
VAAFAGRNAKFDAVSTSAADFHGGVGGKPATPFRPDAARDTVQETRDFRSEAQAQFEHKAVSVRRPLGNTNQIPALVSSPFDSVSTSASSYTHFSDARPAEAYRPKQETSTLPLRDERDFQSEAARHFVSHSGAAVTGPTRATNKNLQRSSWQLAGNSGHFDGVTTNQADYHGAKDGQAALPFRPESNREVVAEDRDFKSEGHSQFDSKGHVAVRRPMPRAQQTVMTASKFDAVSTHAKDFENWQQQGARPSAMYRPPVSTTTTGTRDDRDFRSEASKQYEFKVASAPVRAFATSNVASMQKAQQAAPFEGVTTSGGSYVHHISARPAVSMRPTQQRIAAGAPGTANDGSDNGRDARDFVTEAQANFAGGRAQVGRGAASRR